MRAALKTWRIITCNRCEFPRGLFWFVSFLVASLSPSFDWGWTKSEPSHWGRQQNSENNPSADWEKRPLTVWEWGVVEKSFHHFVLFDSICLSVGLFFSPGPVLRATPVTARRQQNHADRPNGSLRLSVDGWIIGDRAFLLFNFAIVPGFLNPTFYMKVMNTKQFSFF